MNEINSIKSNNIMADEVDNLFDDSLEDVIQTPEKDIDLFSLIEKEFSKPTGTFEEEAKLSLTLENEKHSNAIQVTPSYTKSVSVAENIVNSPEDSVIFSPGFCDPFLCAVTSPCVEGLDENKKMTVSREKSQLRCKKSIF